MSSDEPKPASEIYQPFQTQHGMTSTRAVRLIVDPNWAQVLTRLQQLHNEGCTLVRLMHDDDGHVRIEPQ